MVAWIIPQLLLEYGADPNKLSHGSMMLTHPLRVAFMYFQADDLYLIWKSLLLCGCVTDSKQLKTCHFT